MSETAGKGTVAMQEARRRRLLLFTSLAVLLLGSAGGMLAWWGLRPGLQPLPAYSLNGLDPLVKRLIEHRLKEIAANPQSGEAWGQMGMLFGAYGMRPQAFAAFANAQRFESGEPRWPYFRAVALIQDGAEDNAVAPLQRAVALCDCSPDAPRLRLAELLLRQSHSAEAEVHFHALLAHNPKHAAATLGLARLALLRDQLSTAEELVSLCITSPFVRQAAYRLLAEVRQQRGDAPGAEAALREAAKLPADRVWPDPFLDEVEELKLDRRTRVTRALALRAKNRLEEYHRLMEDLERDYPGTLAQMEGRRLLDAQDYAGAERAFQQAIELDPTFAQAHFWRGVSLLKQQNPRAAADCFREVLRLQPRHAAAFDYLGRCLELLGNRTAAIDAYRSAVRYLPQQAEVHRRLGMLLAEQGHDTEALIHLESALSLRPDLTSARDKAEQIRKRLAAPR